MGVLSDLFDKKAQMQNRIKEYEKQIDLMNTEKALIAKRAERDKLKAEMEQLRNGPQGAPPKARREAGPPQKVKAKEGQA